MRKIVFAVLCLLTFSGYSQVIDSAYRQVRTPYLALRILVTNIESQNLSAATILIGDPTLSQSEKLETVQKLKQILDGAGIFIFFEDVPTQPNHFDSIANEYRYVINENINNIYLQRKNGKWQFQSRVVKNINATHKKMYRFGTDYLIIDSEEYAILNFKVLGIKVWQWLGVVLLFLLSWFIRYIFALIFSNILIRILEKIKLGNIGKKFIVPIASPMGMIVVVFVIAILFPMLQMPSLVGFYIVIALKTLLPIYGMVILYRLVNILEVYFIRIVKKTSNSLDDQMVPMVKKVLKIIIVVMGGLIILSSLNVPILPLITGLSIGGIAFALAAQDSLKNFFGSTMILVDKPFQIGDWITAEGIDGTIERVGFRSTQIRTFRDSVISVPNGHLANITVDNHGLREYRRFRTIIQIKYDTPVALIETFVEGLKQVLQNHPKTNKKKFEIHLNDLGDSSVDILFYIFFEAPTWSDELKYRQEVLLQIMKLAEHLNVQFAFPTQTMHVEEFPGQASLSPTYMQSSDEMKNKLNQFWEKPKV